MLPPEISVDGGGRVDNENNNENENDNENDNDTAPDTNSGGFNPDGPESDRGGDGNRENRTTTTAHPIVLDRSRTHRTLAPTPASWVHPLIDANTQTRKTKSTSMDENNKDNGDREQDNAT